VTAPTLTPRQEQFLHHVADGKTTAEIAAQLWVCEGTVKKTLTDARRRLGAVNTAHAVALGFRAGVLK
jgi:DNA-binding CsgD family transcriptional regulator